jgi:capsular polysaccharide export protein
MASTVDHAPPTAAAGRCILLLQGPRSPFFARLADALRRRGARVERVLLCPGDALFWRGRRAHRFRGSLAAWPGWLGTLLTRIGATDVIGLGDGRPHHRAGFAVARAAGVQVHVLEQGYLRPACLTLERDALGAWQWDGAPGPPLDAPSGGWRQSFVSFAAMDVAHHLANAALGWATYPQYRTHEVWSPWQEWLGWARRAAASAAARRETAAVMDTMGRGSGPVFLLALQLATDFQLRDHGPAGGLPLVVGDTVASFRRDAPAAARLVVKPHPLDPFPWRLRRLVAEAAEGDPRVLWLPGGRVELLWPQLGGVVTVNSTVGLSALRAGVPVVTLGKAIYAPLTETQALADFWARPSPVSPARVEQFLTALAAATQVPGSFDGDGMAPGAEAVAARLLGEGAV